VDKPKAYFKTMTDQELLRWIARADPAVRELIERFENLTEKARLLGEC
tara:strand:+ start:1931 stop:2074 length:144 start_codon:yes stop_codon:yes gene_type:complete